MLPPPLGALALALLVAPAALAQGRPWFEDVTARAGIAWKNVSGAPDQIALVDQNGQGIAVIDYDRDGRPDLFFPNGSTLARRAAGQPGGPWALFRNKGDGTFEDVTEPAGLVEHAWATGACAADLDSDGWPDLYVCGFGGTHLFRNQGDGTFARVPDAGGAHVDGWSSSAAAGDVDGDGLVDLAVARYVHFDPRSQPTGEVDGKPCAYRGVVTGCGPWRWRGAGLKLFRGDGRSFVETTRSAGLAVASDSRGFQVALVDLDADGDLDLYAGCDVMPNVALQNDGRGRFRADPAWGGLVSDEGKAESAMGLAIVDLDGDGLPEIATTNFAGEKNTLYANRAPGGDRTRFTDVSRAAGLDRHSVELDWGASLVDFDLDGRPDLFHVNGHIYPQVAGLADAADSYAQPPRLYSGQPGLSFREEPPLAAPVPRWPARALAIADLDGDLAPDAVIGVHNGAPRVLANRVSAKRRQDALAIELVGTLSCRDALGARVTIGGVSSPSQVRFAAPHQGFQGTHEARVFFGAAHRARWVEVRWPSGRTSRQWLESCGTRRIVEPTSPAIR